MRQTSSVADPAVLVSSSANGWEQAYTIITGIGVVGTLGLFYLAFRQIKTERDARLSTAEAAEKDRVEGQARSISSWIASEGGGGTWYAIENSSKDPVYGVILNVVAYYGAGAKEGVNSSPGLRVFVSIAPPGRCYAYGSEIDRGMYFHPAVEIAFTDRNMRNWARMWDGSLLSLDKQRPLAYYKVEEPISWQLPRLSSPPSI